MALITLTRYVLNRNVRAFLWMLRYGEGTQGPDGYSTLFGGFLFKGPDGVYQTFDDFRDHPRQLVTMRLKKGGKITSSAAGAYQILQKTWDGLVAKYGFENFEPPTQDLAAIALIAGRKALDDIVAGRLEQAVAKCNKEWASLPGSPYGQPVVTLDECKREYLEAGGLLSPTEEATLPSLLPPLPEPKLPDVRPEVTDVQVNPVEKIMALPLALISAILPSLIQLVPQLGKTFGSGSETQARNVEAATKVLEVAKEAIGARNEQEMLERIQSEPEAATAVKEAIEEKWFGLMEVGGGIEAAANRSIAMGGGKLVKGADGSYSIDGSKMVPFHKQPAFIVTLLLMVPVYFVVFMVLQPWWGDTDFFSDEIRLVVVTAIISGVLSAVTGFWLGSSFGSQRKDETRNQAAR